VLRLKRVRNPAVVALEALQKFLHDARAQGLTVLLAGVRADLLAALRRVGIAAELGEAQVFAEEDEDFSATLGPSATPMRRSRRKRTGQPPAQAPGGVYYLV